MLAVNEKGDRIMFHVAELKENAVNTGMFFWFFFRLFFFACKVK